MNKAYETPNVKIADFNGQPTIMINGQPYPPMYFTSYKLSPDYLLDIKNAGFKVFFLESFVRDRTAGNDPKSSINMRAFGAEETVNKMKELIDIIPDAFIIMRINLTPSKEWVNGHPEEQVLYSDGSTGPVTNALVGSPPIDGSYSLCSEVWRQEMGAEMLAYFEKLEQSPLFGRVVGVFVCAGQSWEWFYVDSLVKPSGAYADFSEPFRKEYESFLRRKYKTAENLRRAWKIPDVEFEHPIIPTVEDRYYIRGADLDIQEWLRNFYLASGKIIGMLGIKLNENAENPGNIGVFLNADKKAYVADFYRAWHESVANTILHFAGLLKEHYPYLMLGAFYGYMGMYDYFDLAQAAGVLTLLNSDHIDFLASTDIYFNRDLGMMPAQREIQDAFRIRGKILLAEEDNRTHNAYRLPGQGWHYRESIGVYDAEHTIHTLKREFARNLCEGIGGWWYDMNTERDAMQWYQDKDILSTFKNMQEVSSALSRVPHAKNNEVAFIYDIESTHYVSNWTSYITLCCQRSTDAHYFGAPVDYHFHDDMADPRMPDYKLYVMINIYCLTKMEREAVFAKAQKNNAVVVWLYAPGFIQPDADEQISIRHIEDTVGLKLGQKTSTIFPYFGVDTTHPAMALASPARRYGGFEDRYMRDNVIVGASWNPQSFLNPAFYIDDPDAVVLARYKSDNLPAMALSEKYGFKKIYCAAQTLRPDLIASIAAWAGCHLFTKPGDALFANENLVAIHAADDKVVTIRFKHLCSPFEVYEGVYYGQNVSSIDVPMRLGETKMWSIDYKLTNLITKEEK